MYQLKVEAQFKQDYKTTKKRYPQLAGELKPALEELSQKGQVSEDYNPHLLNNREGNYNGYFEFHLAEGKIDVLVIYLPHKNNPVIRLVRIGNHTELFQGPEK